MVKSGRKTNFSQAKDKRGKRIYFKLILLFFTDQDDATSLLREEARSKTQAKAVWIQNHKLVRTIRQ